MGSVYGPEGLQTYLATKCVFLPGLRGPGVGTPGPLPGEVEGGAVQGEHVLVGFPLGR
jgi:hypothetical protein